MTDDHGSRRTIGGFIVSLAYGIPIQPQDDPYLAFAEYTIQVLSEIFTPGATYVDVIPALKYLPSWFPGAGFKRWAAERRYIADKFRSSPYDAAISCLVRLFTSHFTPLPSSGSSR